MSTKYYSVGPSANWRFVKHEIKSPGCCTLEIAGGQASDAMNLPPSHPYLIMHQTMGGCCMMSVLQLPELAAGAKPAVTKGDERECFCCDQSMPCPKPLQPVCNNGVLQCSQNP
jgi:hypothetical protein